MSEGDAVTVEATSSAKLLAAHWRSMTPTRMADYGVPTDDIGRMQDLTTSGVPWDVAAESLADAQERRAAAAVAHGHLVTGREAFRAAIANLIFAQMAFNDDPPRRRQLYDRLSSMIAACAAISEGSIEKLEPVFGSRSLVGWLVRPSTGPALGTVIVFGGQSGWGAAYWRYADALAARGLATVLAEGPGQGETRLRHGVFLDVDVSDAYSRFVDTIFDDPSLGGSVGIFGNSMGGLYAALTAAADPRVRACCINGAPARPALLGHRTFDEQAAAMVGTSDPERITATFDGLTFDPRRHRIGGALLVLHGGQDVLFGLEAQQPFLDSATEEQTLRVWPDGDHTIYNHCEERTSFVADWFADRLTTF